MKTSLSLLRVLAALLENPDDPAYGYSLMKTTSLRSGSLYPILARLTAEGWVTRETEEARPSEGPARRYYRLTALGVAEARRELASAAAGLTPGQRQHPGVAGA
ncbi:PadR family transcriptional regulator [Streptomyces sp. NBC_00989]|uniref:PadR family transcriptional regulator n=1 Tax=Streptomyces sp. NBC_00989 TaxID=2903705 RepID=UPI003867AD99|nr:PadR family transcriptional regulator [Streptomyces sp. NBC_00989]WSW98156.1 PadR family transcriptional regulator [Streptomyces sp. NBC_00989]